LVLFGKPLLKKHGVNNLFLEKIKNAYIQGKLKAAICRRLRIILKGILGIFQFYGKFIIIHNPKYVELSDKEIFVVERIFESYKKMKQAQKKVSVNYLPSSLWDGHVKIAYASLIEGLENNDIRTFHKFLANFGIWEKYTGIEEGLLIRKLDGNFIGRAYLKQMFSNIYRLWKHFHGNRKKISSLERPSYGNLSGAIIDGVLVTLDTFFSEIYGEQIRNIVSDKKNPVIAELGGGSGRLAYFSIRELEKSTYIDFDLPEILCVAAYYLMLSFPEKKVLLFGESDYDHTTHLKYDMIFMPSFEIEKLGDKTVDIFVNECSLGEMNPDAARNYLKYASLASEYILHINHDRTSEYFSDGTKGILGFEYQLNNFKQLFKYTELKHLLPDGDIDFFSDTVICLYERKVKI